MKIFVKWLSMIQEANVMKTQYYPSIYLCTLFVTNKKKSVYQRVPKKRKFIFSRHMNKIFILEHCDETYLFFKSIMVLLFECV